jgi:hypothetical protein
MSTIKLKKVKLISGKHSSRVEVSYEENSESGLHGEVLKSPDWEPHQDLKDALNNLAPHYALINEFIPIEKKKKIPGYDLALYANCVVSGYSLGGDEGKEGYTITGHRLLSTGKAQIVNTPFELLEPSEGKGYLYMDDLIEKVEKLEDEVLQYLNGSKIAKPAVEQLELEEK